MGNGEKERDYGKDEEDLRLRKGGSGKGTDFTRESRLRLVICVRIGLYIWPGVQRQEFWPRWQYGHEQRCVRCLYWRTCYGSGKGEVFEDRAL